MKPFINTIAKQESLQVMRMFRVTVNVLGDPTRALIRVRATSKCANGLACHLLVEQEFARWETTSLALCGNVMQMPSHSTRPPEADAP